MLEQTNHPLRKSNRLTGFDYAQTGSYYVTVCTQDRMPLLSSVQATDTEPVVVLTDTGHMVSGLILRIAEHFPTVSTDCYIIMPDHMHLLLTFHPNCGTGNPSPTMGNIVGWLKYQTTKTYNTQFNRAVVKLWQRSYYDHVIRNEKDYWDTFQYIQANPIRWLEKHS